MAVSVADCDFDNDNFIGTSDLLALLTNWGCMPPPACRWDLDGDGLVGELDLDVLLHGWGQVTEEVAAIPTPDPVFHAGPRRCWLAGDNYDYPLVVNEEWMASSNGSRLLRIDAAFCQTPGAILFVDIAGRLPGDEHDIVVIDGPAQLDGNITVVLVNGFEPAPDEELTILVADAIGGNLELRLIPETPGLELVHAETRLVLRHRREGVATDPNHAASDTYCEDDSPVTVHDVITLLEHWHQGHSPGDLNADGIVDGEDLRLLFGPLGDC